MGWGALRDELGRTTVEAYREALARAAEIRKTAPLALRCALSYAFPTERAWSDGDGRACLALEEFPGYGGTLLAAPNLEIATQVTRVFPAWEVEEQYLYTAIDAHGDDAVPLLRILLDRPALDSADRGKVARALALIESEDAACLLASCLAQPSLRGVAEKYFARCPALAVRSFARTFVRPDAPGRSAASAIYASVTAARRDDVAEALAPLSEGERRVLESLGASARSEAAAKMLPESAAVRAAWTRIEKWLEKHHPRKTEMLAPGATLDEMNLLEAGIGFSLPDGLRASLFEHNGESDAAVALVDGFELLSTDGILREWLAMRAALAPRPEDDRPLERVDGVRPFYWYTGWIPIASGGDGSFVCVDTSPAEGGRKGQIILMGHGVGPEAVLAQGVLEWLTDLATKMDNGYIQIDEEGSLRSDVVE